ncbi:hypothetical protein BXY66_0549 [Shimia isoporae]|uniref:Uncharacterized protein n=1 Tax=Shimia isoporae TaxID=647720 RepID=A0A4R1NU15_9RHOB|nr:hypothetical protein [Shimia isoporae]TCL08512.1 hypothetical protein BXY66_0549 [Shimia isoporae]
MSLTVLLALVVFGIAGITALLHVTGHTASQRFASEEEARAAWHREVPDKPVTGVRLSSDKRAALITFQNGAGVVWTLGDDTVARVLDTKLPTSVARGLRFTFHDFGSSSLTVRLDEKERDHWRRLLRA